MTKAAAETKPGHYSGLDPAQERALFINYPRLAVAEASMAGTKGEIAGIYKNLDSANITKADIKWLNWALKNNPAEVMDTMQRRFGMLRAFGHSAGRRFDLFDKDRTPIEDAAYEEGRARGRLRGENANPYGMDSVAGQNWQRGFNDGHAERNQMDAELLNDNIIKGSEPDDGGDAEEEDDGDHDAGNDDDDWDAADPARAAE